MDTPMLRAAVLFAASTLVNTIIGFRRGVPGEPFGLAVPGASLADRASTLLLTSGVSAPWPMPAAGLTAAACARPGRAWPRRTAIVVGGAVLCGTLVEPVTWGRRSRAPLVLATVPLNLLSGVALILAGRGAAPIPGRTQLHSTPAAP